MSTEGGPSPEAIREAYIIDEIKSVSPEQMMRFMQGKADPNDAVPIDQQPELRAWIEEHEANAEKLENGSLEWARDLLNFELKRADLYHQAGYTALEKLTLEDAEQIAEFYEFKGELRKIYTRLSEIEDIR